MTVDPQFDAQEFSTHLPLTAAIPFAKLMEDDVLLCPICGWEYTHIDDVQVLTASGLSMHVHAGGEDEYSTVAAAPITVKSSSRRHEIVLIGSCEEMHRFCIHFIQHKGVTMIEVHRLSDVEQS